MKPIYYKFIKVAILVIVSFLLMAESCSSGGYKYRVGKPPTETRSCSISPAACPAGPLLLRWCLKCSYTVPSGDLAALINRTTYRKEPDNQCLYLGDGNFVCRYYQDGTSIVSRCGTCNQ